jgi:hypothetical protein
MVLPCAEGRDSGPTSTNATKRQGSNGPVGMALSPGPTKKTSLVGREIATRSY